MENLADLGAGGEAELDQIVAGDEGFGFDLFLGKFRLFGDKESVDVQFAVAGGAVDAVKFQFLAKSWPGEESLQGANPHLRGVFEGHVVGDAGHNRLNDVVGEAEAAQDLLGHPGADPFMAEETNST